MRPADAAPLGKVRQISRLQRLSGMQEHPPVGKARGSGNQVSRLQRRKPEGAKIAAGKSLLWLRPLSRLEICLLGPSGGGALSPLWPADPRGETDPAWL